MPSKEPPTEMPLHRTPHSIRVMVLALVAALGAGCAGSGSVPAAAVGGGARGTSESAMGMPGESAMGLPGESAMGMPGAQFACTGLPAPGTASCTLAINLNAAPSANPNQPAALIPGLHPDDLQSAYALPSQNAGGLVAVVDAYDAPGAESDLAVYRSAFGLGDCTSANGCFRKIDQRGRTALPAPNGAWAEETALDLQMVSAACPRCTIVLVEADSASLDDLGAAVDTAASLGPKAISNSYYALEWSGESAENVHYHHQGIAVTASSGDRGYAAYPAASPYVTAVGGTSLRAASGGWSESPWEYTGHGCSAFVPTPRWQTGTSCTTRSAVDLAAVADPQTGVATFDAAAGGWLVAGGTSVGAPLVAAAYALSGRPAAPGYSYRHPAGFRPVGGTGYQPITGLGSLNGVTGL